MVPWGCTTHAIGVIHNRWGRVVGFDTEIVQRGTPHISLERNPTQCRRRCWENTVVVVVVVPLRNGMARVVSNNTRIVTKPQSFCIPFSIEQWSCLLQLDDGGGAVCWYCCCCCSSGVGDCIPDTNVPTIAGCNKFPTVVANATICGVSEGIGVFRDVRGLGD